MSRSTISVICNDKITRAVKADVERGLGLHKGIGQHRSKWVISHVETGRKIVSFYIRSLAQGCMIELAYSTNWNSVDNSDENQELLLPIIKPIIDRWRYIEATERGEGT